MSELGNIWARLSMESQVFVILISFFGIYFHRRFNSDVAHKAPAFLTTFGILGTFLGITIGLFNFDSSDVQKSVPELIEGIKTAFVASALGVMWAITIKLRDIFHKKDSVDYSGATVDDLAKLLSGLQQSIAGNDDSTLLSQLKLLRVDNNERLDKVSRQVEEFYNKVAENSSKALIEALKEVIREFNEKISEQFGENFKQLNHAVGQLLEWQNQYRQQMTEMVAQQKSSAESMAIATQKFEEITEKTERFTATANSLQQLIAALEAQRDQIKVSLEALGKLLERSSGALPEIEKKIVEMVAQVSSGVQQTQQELRGALLESVKASNQETMSWIKNSNQEFNNHVRQMIDKTHEQIINLDKALSEELTKSLEGLGKQLASLSQKFAEDYTPITENLRKIVRLGQ